MKLSDYVAQFLASQGIKHAFVVTGGADAHIIDSIAQRDDIDYICTQHEQAAAMAADAYSRVTRNLGVAIATSGCGATNLITGVCCAYYDSVPTIFITGQVATFRSHKGTGVRQLGFQEADTVDIFKPFTKYAVQIDNPKRIRYELEKATHLAVTARSGAVLVDIPDDVQRADINPNELESYIPSVESQTPIRLQVDQCIPLLARAKRPVIILGWGVRLARAEAEMYELINRLGFPVLPTWAATDMLPSTHPLLVGAFGQHGTRYGNFAVQNADLLLVIGSRLDTHLTGTPTSSFAREAQKIVVDIDIAELNKYSKIGIKTDMLIQSDAKEFLRLINSKIDGLAMEDISEWQNKIAEWKAKYPICLPKYYEQDKANPYVFVKYLSQELKEGDIIVVDSGCSVAWMLQAFDCKRGQRLLSAFNNTPMGYALPASIGASFANNKGRVICVTGDGGLQMNIQELVTIIKHKLPIKIFVMNNHGYSMMKQTQDEWFDSRYVAADEEHGLAFPDFIKVAKAYGYKTLTIDRNDGMIGRIKAVLNDKEAVFCNVEIPSNQQVIPKAKFGYPIEDSEPLLDREELKSNMIVKPMQGDGSK